METEFIHPILLGENVLPYRVLPAREAVLPLEGNNLIPGDNDRLDLYPGLAEWWRNAEQLWEQHRSSDRLSLLEQIDFRNKLVNQLPGTPLRLVYGKAGMHVAAALVDTPNSIIDHTLYWGTVASHEEGIFLCAILNSPVLTEAVCPLMSYGKDERHIDKHLWKLPIPRYDSANPLHQRLVVLGHQESEMIRDLDLDESNNFVVLRRAARSALAAGSATKEIEEIVRQFLGS